MARGIFPQLPSIQEIVDTIYEKFVDRSTEDAFAAVAMAMLMLTADEEDTPETIANDAYKQAEAMMKRRG